MGQAQRRKQLGSYPTVEIKPRKPVRIRYDIDSSLMRQAFMAIALSNLAVSKHRLPGFIRSGF